MSKPAVEIVTLGEQAIWGIGGAIRRSNDLRGYPFQRLIIPRLPCRGEACFPSLFCPETMMAGMVPLNYLWAAHLKKTGWSRRFFPPGNMLE